MKFVGPSGSSTNLAIVHITLLVGAQTQMGEEKAMYRTVQFSIREQLLRSIAKQFQEGSYLRLVDFCITQL